MRGSTKLQSPCSLVLVAEDVSAPDAVLTRRLRVTPLTGFPSWRPTTRPRSVTPGSMRNLSGIPLSTSVLETVFSTLARTPPPRGGKTTNRKSPFFFFASAFKLSSPVCQTAIPFRSVSTPGLVPIANTRAPEIRFTQWIGDLKTNGDRLATDDRFRLPAKWIIRKGIGTLPTRGCAIPLQDSSEHKHK